MFARILRTCIVPLLVCLAVVFVPLTVNGQNRVRFSNFAKQIPQSHTEVIAVNNVAGHIETIINSRSLERVMEEGSFADVFGMAGTAPDMDMARDWLADNRAFIPSTIAIAADDEIYPFVTNILEGLLRMNVAESTFRGDDYEEEDLVGLEKETLEILKVLKVPDICVWIEWEERFTGEQIFESFQAQASLVGQLTDLKYAQQDDAFEIKGTLEDLIDPGQVGMFFQFMGFDDEQGQLALTALDLELYFKAEWVNDGMRITIGRNSDEQPRAGEIEGVNDGDLEIAFGDWSGIRMRESFEKLEQSMDRWAETSIGRMFRAQDTEDLWGTYSQMIEQSRMFAADGTMRCWREANQILVTIVETDMPEPDSLAGSEILATLPAEAESYAFSGQRSMMDFLAAWIIYYEDRAARESLQRNLQGEVEQAMLLEQVMVAYFEHFAPMREVIMNDLVEADSPPFAMLMDTKGRIDSLRIDLDVMDAPVEMNLDRFPRMIAVSQTNQPELMRDGMLQAFELLIDGVFSANDITRPAGSEFIEELELGDGVIAHLLSPEWMDDTELGSVKLKGDLRPHIFIDGQHVYFSTSLNLSRKVIQQDSGIQAPETEDGTTLVNFGRFQGRTMGNMFRTLINVVATFVSGGANPFEEQIFNSMGNGFAELTGLMNYVEWSSKQKDGIRQTDYVLDFQGS